jgi:hypothetical protein
MGKSTKIEQPAPVDPGKAMGEYLFGQDFSSFQGVTDPRLQERIIGAEEQFRPRYAELELQDIQTFARGTDEQAGVFDLLEESGRRAAAIQRESLAEQRAEDVAALEELSPQVVEAYRAADPQSARLADLAAQQAETAFAEAAGPIGFEAQRQIDQSVLGRLGGTAATQTGRAALEAALGREQFVQGRRRQAAELGGGAFQQSRAIAGDLGAAILGRPSQSLALGGQLLGQSQQLAAGPMGPQLFDPNVGINLAMQQRAQNIELAGAQAQANAARGAGTMGAIGSIGGALIGLCWVAREAYGHNDHRWLLFRDWLLFKAPRWFRNLYIKHGRNFAKFIRNKPLLKKAIRGLMNTILKLQK